MAPKILGPVGMTLWNPTMGRPGKRGSQRQGRVFYHSLSASGVSDIARMGGRGSAAKGPP
jgi:hypothetical protein